MEKFAEHVNTNYAPSLDEIAELRGLIDAPIARIKALNSAIDRLQLTLVELHHERQTISESIEPYQALLSPIRRLPQEILERIFIHCLATAHNPVMSSETAPLLLTRICSSWRRSALGCPRLWACLHIPIPAQRQRWVINSAENAHLHNKVVEHRQMLWDAVFAWLRRSGDMPLSISVFQPAIELQGERSEEILYFRAMYDMLLLYRRRWSRIEVSAPMWALNTIFDSEAVICQNSLPLLASITIDSQNCTDQEQFALPQSLWHETALLCSPSLRSITLTNTNIHYTLPAWPAWAQLTQLCINGHNCNITEGKALAVLATTSRLISCELSISIADEEDGFGSRNSTFPAVVTLSALKFFSITGSGDIRHFLERLRVPSLQHMEYLQKGSSVTRDGCAEVLLSPSVRQLTLSQMAFGSDYIHKCLRRTPFLISLHLRFQNTWDAGEDGMLIPPLAGSTLDDDLLDSLSSTDICPQLEELECSQAEFSDASLLRFINARRDMLAIRGKPDQGSLRRVRVYFNRPCISNFKYADFEKELAALKESGMELSLVYPPAPFRGPLSPWGGIPLNTQQTHVQSLHDAM